MTSQTAQSTSVAKRRAPAIAGAIAGLVVVIVLFAVLFTINVHKSDKSMKSAAAPVPSAAPANPAPADTAAAPAPAEPAPVDTPPALRRAPVVRGGTGTIKKLTVTPLVKGTGPVVKAGQTITANYVVVTYADGKTLDSSWTSGKPFNTPIGTGAVIAGWDQAIPGQRVGSRLQLDVPAALAYGPQQGDLRFVVDILAAQ